MIDPSVRITITDGPEVQVNGEPVCAMEIEVSDGGVGGTFITCQIVGLESGKCLVPDAQFELPDSVLESLRNEKGAIEFALLSHAGKISLRAHDNKIWKSLNA